MPTRQVKKNTLYQLQKQRKRAAYLKANPRRQNPIRASVLRGISIAAANAMQVPEYLNFTDKLEELIYKVQQHNLANQLNEEFISRSSGKGGKKPARIQFIKSVFMAKDHTNPMGHFA